VQFTTGSSTTTTAHVNVVPGNGATNIGTNARVQLLFDAPIDTTSVTDTTVQVTANGTAELSGSISFTNNYREVDIVPMGLFPASTPITVTVNGVTDLAGNAVVSKTVTFTTGPGPDFNGPQLIYSSLVYGATGVPINSAFTFQFNKPIDSGLVNNGNFCLSTGGFTCYPSYVVAGAISVSTDGTQFTFTPTAALAVGTTYYLYFVSPTDLSGNTGTGPEIYFTTGFAADTTGPQVLGISPQNGLTGVPINTQILVKFDRPIQPNNVGQVTLTSNGTAVPSSIGFTNGNQMLPIYPDVPLTAGTQYTVTVAGVTDIAGNAIAAPVTSTFTTGTGADLTSPQVVSVNPPYGATGVGTNVVLQVTFNKPIDPLLVTNLTFYLRNSSNGAVTVTLGVSRDLKTVTLTPVQALPPGTIYNWYIYGTDLAGDQVSANSNFATQ